MSKNSGMNKEMQGYDKITKDESFKAIARYKCIASLFIRLCIEDFKDTDYVDIARSIVDISRERPEMTDEEVMEDEIDMLDRDIGTGSEKNTLNDIVFLVRYNDKYYDKITVNFEMQNIVNEKQLGYNIISRGVYYGASLLRDTVPAGDTKYSNIHKVYSIWFCANNLNLDLYSEKAIENEFIHRYNFGRHYKKIGKVAIDKEADLIEVTFVELQKLKYAVSGNMELIDAINTLFFNSSNSIDKIETITKINLTKIRRQSDMQIDFEAATKRYVEEAKEEARAEKEEAIAETEESTSIKLTYNFIRSQMNKGYTKEKLAKMAVSILGVSDEIVEKAYAIVEEEKHA
jgi:hypothetical protein